EMGSLGIVPAGLSFDGIDGPVTVESFFEPCAARSRLLVVRTSAAWCGSCLWDAAHTKRFLDDPRFAGRLLLLELIVADEENAPVTGPALTRWRQKLDASTAIIAADPRYRFGAALSARAPLPVYSFVDTRTMKILSTLSAPDPS